MFPKLREGVIKINECAGGNQLSSANGSLDGVVNYVNFFF